MATTVLQVRMDENLRDDASKVFENLGMDLPTAIRVFLKRAVAERGIPFEVREPRATYTVNSGWDAFMALREQAQNSSAAGMSETEIESEISNYRAGK